MSANDLPILETERRPGARPSVWKQTIIASEGKQIMTDLKRTTVAFLSAVLLLVALVSTGQA
ncbi:MAG: hypothetical protein ACI9JE_001108, partial [Candidatus Krumholzibacteriia bacterium]